MAKRVSKGPSLAKVADLAGVSVSTVSKVLNGGGDVGEDTRARVLAILSEQEYVPRRRRSLAHDVTLLVRSITMPSTGEIMRGAIVQAQLRGARVSVVQNGDDDPADGWTSRIGPRGTAAVVAIHSVLDPEDRSFLEDRGVPLVVVNPKDAPHVGAYSVGATNWAGGLAATQHLLGLGHRSIVMLSGDEDSMISRARVSGFRDALDAAGVERSADAVVAGRFTFESGLRQGIQVLERDARPTAVFAGSDQQAMGVLEAARRIGVRVPEQLSVIGFDDLVMAAMTSPPLTTVRQPFDQMGASAVTMALDLLEGREPPAHHLELATELVERGSVVFAEA